MSVCLSVGVTLVAASGDDGASSSRARSVADGGLGASYCGYAPQFPASCPYVTAVGATQGVDTNTVEITCQSNLGSAITSGGGFSKVFIQGSWQKKLITKYFTTVNGTSKQPVAGFKAGTEIGRGYPDVSLAGANYLIYIGGSQALVSGTSASAPVMAALFTLVNAVRLSTGTYVSMCLWAVCGQGWVLFELYHR